MDDSFDVMILGASFAGIEVYHQLRRSSRGRALSVCIVDRQPEHPYIPLVHERLLQRPRSSTQTLATQSCVEQDARARYVVADVVGLQLGASNTVLLDRGIVLRARFIIVALGSELAPPPTLAGSEHLVRYKFARECAAARAALHEALHGSARHFVVIGGGVSGVELAGELAHVTGQRARPHVTVSLIQAGGQLLHGFHARIGRIALRKLRAQGVRVHLGTRVLSVRTRSLQVQTDGAAVPHELEHDLAFWAAGIRPNPLLASLGLPRTAHGYLMVGATMQCYPGAGSQQPQLFACGDAVRVVDERGEWPTMQRAIECLWQAKVVARNVLVLSDEARSQRLCRHTLRRAFPYGISIGACSMIVYRRLAIDLGRLGVWFRRFLMRQYMKRYTPAAVKSAKPPRS